MPLIRFEVRNEVGLGDPGLYGGGAAAAGAAAAAAAAVAGNRGTAASTVAAAGEEEPKALLEGVAVAGLVGILRQLGDLAEFAADVFHDLHEQVIATSARGRKVLTRVQNIEAALPSLEKAVKNQKSHIHFAYVPGSDWHTQLQNEQNHLLASDLPRFMMDSYEECRDPPRLYLLDKFDNAGAGACVKRYSDPSYFKKAWDMMRTDKTANLQREKRSQKIKRKGSRLREPYHGLATSRHRGTEFQRSLTAGQLVNRQFASPSNDGQNISEHRSTPDARSNADNMSRSSSLSSKTQLSSVEQAFDTNPSAVPHENGHGKSLDAKLHKPGGLPSRGTYVDDHSDHLKEGSPPVDMVARSPYVKWDEKAAIIMSTSSVYCDDVVMDKAEDAEPTCISSVQKETDHKVMDTLEQQDALLKKTKSLLVPSVLNHHVDIPGEADNYMDALNTLESETETESEFQSKNQEVPAPSFNAEAPQVGAIDNIVPHCPDSSAADFTDTYQESDILCTSERAIDFPSVSNADSLEISQLEFSDYTSVSPYKESSVIPSIHESGAEGACGDPCEIMEPQVHSAILSNDVSPVCNEIPKSKPDNDLGCFPQIPQLGFSTCMVIPSSKDSAVANENLESDGESVGDLIDGTTDNFVSGPNIPSMTVDEVEMVPADKSPPGDQSDDSCVIPESRPQDYDGKSHEGVGDCGVIGVSKLCSESLNKPSDNVCATQDVPTNTSTMSAGASEVSSSWSEPHNELMENRCATQGVPANASTTSTVVPSVKLWTNAGLFGLEPSKPPVFGAQDGPMEDSPPGFKEAQPVHSTELTGLHYSKPTESAVVDIPNGNTSIPSSFVEKLVGIRPGSANPNSSGANQSAARIPDPIHSHTDGHSDFSSSFEHNNMTGKHTSISELLESEGSAEIGTEIYSTDMKNSMHMVSASSFSSIAQRFLANTLQRRTSSKFTDLPLSSERTNADTNAKDESTLNRVVEPSETVFAEETKFENKTENGTDGLTKSSVFSSGHYSEKSSPPLEYMKISFHPMSAFEMSKLNLDFCDSNLHEISDDMMLPTFQLLSESSIPQPGSGSESEDDTFGRSYSYSSYDDLSPRLYSNSEVWDQEDGVGLEEHELYDDSNQIGSSTAPLSSYMGFEQMILPGTKSDISLANVRDQNVTDTLESCTVEELPNFDTLMSRSDDQNGETSIPHSLVNLPPEEDQLPPPPPLPPMQWRMTRQTTSIEEETGITAKDVLRKTSSLPHVHTSAQDEHLPPTASPDLQEHAKEVDVQKTGGVREITNPPSIIDIKSSLLQQIRDKSEQLKLNDGHESSKKAVGSDIKVLDEREELLQQIRSKTFNLRRTNASKTDGSSQSTANSNVVAILEKANAIRQAVASDEGGDDDTWSDI